MVRGKDVLEAVEAALELRNQVLERRELHGLDHILLVFKISRVNVIVKHQDLRLKGFEVVAKKELQRLVDEVVLAPR